MQKVQFYFDYRSPYSYLAQSQVGDLDLTICPVDILDVMKRVGNTPTTIMCPPKGRYAGADLIRWVARYKVSFAQHSQFEEIEGRRLLRATLAVEPAKRRAASAALFHALWGDPAPLGTIAGVAAILSKAGLDAAAIEPLIDAPEMDAALNKASAEAASRGVFGAPTFFVGDEMFFGNDRLDFLREALARAA
jgi:2-hydroxychromene-2-carboxylate isomerase